MADNDKDKPATEIKITPEMRRAVYTEDCFQRGHVLDFSQLINYLADVPAVIGGVVNVDKNKLPYVECDRCGSTWIVIPHAGSDYNDAERYLYSHLDATSKMAKKIVREKGERDKRPPKLPPRLQQM